METETAACSLALLRSVGGLAQPCLYKPIPPPPPLPPALSSSLSLSLSSLARLEKLRAPPGPPCNAAQHALPPPAVVRYGTVSARCLLDQLTGKMSGPILISILNQPLRRALLTVLSSLIAIKHRCTSSLSSSEWYYFPIHPPEKLKNKLPRRLIQHARPGDSLAKCTVGCRGS